ncbi:MAG: DMT family transporter [Adlercreutzia sp.]
MALACALVFRATRERGGRAAVAWGTIAFLALLSTCLTFMLQNVALTELPSSTVSLLLTGEPVFTAAFSFMLLGEALSAAGMAGAVVIVASVVAATWVEGRQSAPAASLAPQAEHALALEEGGSRRGVRRSIVPGGVELSHLAPSERRSFASERAA